MSNKIYIKDKILSQDSNDTKTYSNLYSVDQLPNGKLIIGAGGVGCVKIFDIEKGEEGKPFRKTKVQKTNYISVCAMASGNFVCCNGNDIQIWNPTKNDYNNPDVEILDNKGKVNALIVLKNGKIVSAGSDNCVRVFDDSGPCLSTFKAEKSASSVLSICELVDGTIAAGDCSKLRFWDPTKESLIQELNPFQNQCTSACLGLKNGIFIGACKNTQKMEVWDLKAGKRIGDFLTGYQGDVLCLKELPDGRVASCGTDKTWKVWNMDTRKFVSMSGVHTETVNSICVLKDGSVATCSNDGKIIIWKTKE